MDQGKVLCHLGYPTNVDLSHPLKVLTWISSIILDKFVYWKFQAYIIVCYLGESHTSNNDSNDILFFAIPITDKGITLSLSSFMKISIADERVKNQHELDFMEPYLYLKVLRGHPY